MVERGGSACMYGDKGVCIERAGGKDVHVKVLREVGGGGGYVNIKTRC